MESDRSKLDACIDQTISSHVIYDTDLLLYTLISVTGNLLELWSNISVNIYFKSSVTNFHSDAFLNNIIVANNENKVVDSLDNSVDNNIDSLQDSASNIFEVNSPADAVIGYIYIDILVSDSIKQASKLSTAKLSSANNSVKSLDFTVNTTVKKFLVSYSIEAFINEFGGGSVIYDDYKISKYNSNSKVASSVRKAGENSTQSVNAKNSSIESKGNDIETVSNIGNIVENTKSGDIDGDGKIGKLFRFWLPCQINAPSPFSTPPVLATPQSKNVRELNNLKSQVEVNCDLNHANLSDEKLDILNYDETGSRISYSVESIDGSYMENNKNNNSLIRYLCT